MSFIACANTFLIFSSYWETQKSKKMKKFPYRLTLSARAHCLLWVLRMCHAEYFPQCHALSIRFSVPIFCLKFIFWPPKPSSWFLVVAFLDIIRPITKRDSSLAIIFLGRSALVRTLRLSPISIMFCKWKMSALPLDQPKVWCCRSSLLVRRAEDSFLSPLIQQSVFPMHSHQPIEFWHRFMAITGSKGHIGW